MTRATVEIDGFRMYLNPDDCSVSPALAEEGVWEPLETFLVERRVHQDAVVVDVGANIGYYTLLLSQLVGRGGRVFAFEPEPTNYSLLCDNLALNGCENVTAVNAAVGDEQGRRPLYIAPENKGDHRLFTSPEDSRDSVIVDVVTLDDYFAKKSLAPDFLKADVQGAEGAVLRGARSLVEHSVDLELLIEVWPEGLWAAGTDARSMLQSLEGTGFTLYNVDQIEPLVAASPETILEECLEYTTVFCCRTALAPDEVREYEALRRTLPPDRTRWIHSVAGCLREVGDVVGDDVFVLADGGQFGDDFPARALPFVEFEGAYWGAPEDGPAGVVELERLRHQGARFAAFAWTAFWWLDYYSELADHLASQYAVVHESPSVLIYDLRKPELR